MRNILTVTTSTLMGNYEIEKYYGYISINFVTGANFLRDWFAGWTDILGGVSKSYTRELDELKSMARNALENKARLLDMNCILGLNIDLDPIFSSNYSMFMVSATGTACKISNLINDDDSNSEEENIKLDLSRLYSNTLISNAPLDFYNCTLDEIEGFLASLPSGSEKILVDKLIKELGNNPTKNIFSGFKDNIDSVTEFLLGKNFSEVCRYVTDDITKEKALFIKTFNIIDYSSILEQFRNLDNNDTEIDLLVSLIAKPPLVTKDNFYALGELIDLLEKKYQKDVTIKSQGFGKKKDMWICKHCGSPAEMDRQSCFNCNYDRYGLPSRITRYVAGDGQIFNYEKRISNLKSIYEILKKYYSNK